MKIDWKKKTLVYEEYLFTKCGVTEDIFRKWLKIYHPEELKEKNKITAKTGKKSDG